MIAIDRTGSMCNPTGPGGTCTDLNNAKDGVRTMLGTHQPALRADRHARLPARADDRDRPPARRRTTHSATTATTATTPPTRGYVTDTINGNYKTGDGAQHLLGPLPAHRRRAKQLLHPGRRQHVLQRGAATGPGRARSRTAARTCPNYIVFLTDGEANIGSVYGANDPTYPPGNADDQQPCHTAINVANAYKAARHHDLQHRLRARQQRCRIPAPPASGRPSQRPDVWNKKHTKIITPGVPAHPCDPALTPTATTTANEPDESPAITSSSTLTQIASPGDFYNQPNAAQLDTIFAAIATDIGQGSSRLVDDGF